ncbi:hypothetical protein PINS_up004794 [Pythium insidiosum]|nr:hypothetical protein PINS_up004794 [Pythium insidiosum]
MASGRSRLEIAALARLRRLYETPIPSRLTEPSTHSSNDIINSSSSSNVLETVRSRRPPTSNFSSSSLSPLELWLTLHTLQRELQIDCDALRREVQLCDDQTAPSKRLQLTVDANALGVTAPKWLVLREVLGAATFHQYVRDVFRDVAVLRRRAALYGERWRRFEECVRLGCIVGHERLLTSVSHERCLDLLNDALQRVALLVSSGEEEEEEEEADTQSLLLSEAPVLVKHCSDPSKPQQIVIAELLELLGRLPPARERLTRLCFEQLADARRGDGVAPPPDAVKAHRLVSLAKQSHAKRLASDAELDAVRCWLDGAGYRDVSMDSFLAWHIPQSDALVEEDAEFVSLLQRIWGFDVGSSARYEQLHAVVANYESRQELVASRARKQDVLQRVEHAVTSVLPGRLMTLQQLLAGCATATFDRPGAIWELAMPYVAPNTVPSPLSTAFKIALSALQTLRLVGLDLRSFPSVLADESAFPALQVLDLQSNRLADPLPRAIGQRKTLQALLLAQNELEDACFPADLDAWDGLKALETLELSSNRLTRLPLVVSGLSGLKALSLAGNRLRDVNALPLAVLQRWAARGCCLETLDLRENALTVVPAELFVAIASTLERLFLQHNELESLPAAFMSLTRLHDVQLSHNRLLQLDGDLLVLLSRCSLVQTVDLAHNQLLQFPLTNQTTSISSVRVLRMHRNRLRVLPSLPSVSFSVCEELWLQHNRIKLVPDDFFASFPALRVCNLSENALHLLPDSVSNCQRLETLDLHGNRLEAAPAALSSLVHLQVLNLRDNRLSSVPIEWHRFAMHTDPVTQRSPVLHTLQLQKNPLRNKVLRLLVDGEHQRVSHHAFQTAETTVCEMYVRKLIDHLKQTTAVVALARAVHRDVEEEDAEEEEQEENEGDEGMEALRRGSGEQRVRLRQRRWKGRARHVLQLLTQRLLEASDTRVRLPSLRFQELLGKLQPASSKKEVRLMAARFVVDGDQNEALVDGVAFLAAVEAVGLYGSLTQRTRPNTPSSSSVPTEDTRRSAPLSVGKPQSTTTAILQYLQVAHEQRQQPKETKREEVAAPEKVSTPLKTKSTARSVRPASANNNQQRVHQQPKQQRPRELASTKAVDSSADERRRDLESSRQRERIRVLEQQLLDQQLLRLSAPAPCEAVVKPEDSSTRAPTSDTIVISVRSLSPASSSASAPKPVELVVSRSARVSEIKAAIAGRLAIVGAFSKQLFLIVRRPEDATNVRLGERDEETEIARWLSPGARRLQVSVLFGETLRVAKRAPATPGE